MPPPPDSPPIDLQRREMDEVTKFMFINISAALLAVLIILVVIILIMRCRRR